MDTYKKVKIECIKQNIKMPDLAKNFGYSRQALYKNILKENKKTLSQLETILKLPKGSLLQE